MSDIQWLIGGEAGYGIMTTGQMMAKIFTRLGLSVFDYVEYPSLIRGGHNAYYVRASEETIYSQKKGVDILIALNRETIDQHKDELEYGAAIMYDSNSVKIEEGEFDSDKIIIPIPLIDFIRELGVDRLLINTITIGASLALFHEDYVVLQKIMEDTFRKKGEEVVKLNIKTSKKGFDYIKKQFSHKFKKKFKKKQQQSILISGAESVALGAIRAGVKFAAIYPMTPINSITTKLSEYALRYNIVLKEPEDEIAGINMAIGASYAGVRSMVATSGGGFSLMVEAVGLSGQTETPLVIVMGMRPGPSTGMPTWTEQGDLRFVLHAAQGDFPRIVLAPGDLRETFSFTMRAFNLAEKYQLPVIILVDKYLMEGHGTVSISEIKADASWFKVERGKLIHNDKLKGETDYKRYLITSDGISPRSLPGQEGGIGMTGSDEHDERGLYSEDATVRVTMMKKRFKKLEVAEKDILQPGIIGQKDADLTLVLFGSTKLPALESLQWLRQQGINVNVLQVISLSPFPAQKVLSQLTSTKKTLLLEENFTGQFEGLIREKTGFVPTDRLRKYDGRPFYPEEIVQKVKQMV